jgi:hypothetical protein
MSVPELNTSGGRSPRGLLQESVTVSGSAALYLFAVINTMLVKASKHAKHKSTFGGSTCSRADMLGLLHACNVAMSTFTQPISCPGRVLLENIRSSPKEPHIHPPVHPSTPRSCRPMCWGPVMEVLDGTRRRSIGATGQLLH